MNPLRSIQDFITNHLPANTVTYTGDPTPAVPVDKIRHSIGLNETSIVKGDPYASYQYSGDPKLGNAIGRYRVTAGELRAYAPKYLGQPVTPQQFQASSTLQDKYMNGKIAALAAQGYTPQQIADIHNTGMTHAGAPGTTTYQNPAYVANFNKTFLAPPAPQPRTITALNQ